MMSVDDVLAALRACLMHLSPEHGATRLVQQHLGAIAARLSQLGAEGLPDRPPPPYLGAEVTPPLSEAWAPFATWWAAGAPDPAGLARAIQAAGTSRLLVLLGQRVTPASLTDARAIPPTRGTLLAAADAPLDAGLTVAARAWAKHAARSADPFWGTPAGAAAEKNAGARALVVRILYATTWWNVFGHASHRLVYEARVASGHGARWSDGGTRFVGFLDPFDPGQRA